MEKMWKILDGDVENLGNVMNARIGKQSGSVDVWIDIDDVGRRRFSRQILIARDE